MSARKTAVLRALQLSSFPELVNTDPEWWVGEVPKALFPAALAVRNQFAKAVVGEWATVTSDLLNSRLREPDQNQDEIHFPEDIRVAEYTLERFRRGLQQRTCPATFEAFFDLYIQGLVEPARRSIANLRSIIARANPSVSDPVRWVESQAKHLVRTHRSDIHVWIDGAFDRKDTNPRLALLKAFRGTNVPELIRMEPAGIFPYDASRMWNLLEEKSWHFVTLKADDYVRRMDSVIEDAVDQMRIDLPSHQPTGARPVLELRKHGTKRGMGESSSKLLERTRKKETGQAARRYSITKALALSKSKKHRLKVIFSAIQMNDRGSDYCKSLDDRKLHVPTAWSNAGCPPKYIDAYQIPKWRKRIYDEKTKYKEKYDQLTAAERKKLLQ